MDFCIPEELKQLQALARRFVGEQMLPLEDEVERRGEFPHDVRQELRRKAREVGLWGLSAPLEYGGGGIGELGVALVFEELGKVSYPLAGGYIIGDDRCWPLHIFATKEQMEEYFLPTVRGERESCISLTEPDAGSDAAAIKTRAVKSGDNYVINGTKRFTSAVDVADFALVYASTDPGKKGRGITCFLVDKSTPGFNIERYIPLWGSAGLKTAEIVYSDCTVPARNVLGPLDRGLSLALHQLTIVRIRYAARAVGTMERILGMAKDYAKQRVTFGQPLATRQIIQWKLADMAINIFASRAMVRQTAWEQDQGMDTRTNTMIIKLFATQAAFKAADDAYQIFGGIAHTRDLIIGRMWQDLRFSRIGDGADEIMKMTIATNILRD